MHNGSKFTKDTIHLKREDAHSEFRPRSLGGGPAKVKSYLVVRETILSEPMVYQQV